MNLQKEHWNNVYESISAKVPKYDLWLDKYEKIF